MGLLIQTQFETEQGLSVSGVYCRIGRIIFDPVRSAEYCITLQPETYVSRDARLRFKSPLQTPGIPASLSFQGTFGDMASLYGLLKTRLESQGFTVEDVIEPPTPEPEPEPEPTPEASPQSSESTPSTLPTPPTPSESVPPESQPEPQPQSSSEYAPAPAATEA